MLIKVNRIASAKDSTLGTLHLDEAFECFTLEDEAREVKIPGETRIPHGVYRVEFREELTPLTRKYRKKYQWFTWHLELQEVPGFKYVYIHIGNNSDNTNGCLLVGFGAQVTEGEFTISSSALAFRELYNKVSIALITEKVVIEIL